MSQKIVDASRNLAFFQVGQLFVLVVARLQFVENVLLSPRAHFAWDELRKLRPRHHAASVVKQGLDFLFFGGARREQANKKLRPKLMRFKIL